MEYNNLSNEIMTRPPVEEEIEFNKEYDFTIEPIEEKRLPKFISRGRTIANLKGEKSGR